jgi:polar amino acid transport system permease protein
VDQSAVTTNQLPGADGRRAVPRAQIFRTRTILALLISVAVVALMWLALTAFRNSLNLSSFDVTGQPPKTSFEVVPCNSESRFKFGRTGEKDNPDTGERAGATRVSVPSGCWKIRADADGFKGLVPLQATAPVTSGERIALILTTLLGLIATALIYPAARGVLTSRKAALALERQDTIEARINGDDARQWSSYVFGIGAAMTVAALLLSFLALANGQVRTPFFKFSLMTGKFGLIIGKFAVNVKIFVIAEVFVLVWGLVVAIARLAPGKAGAPVRWMAIFYIDLFRGIPAVITLTIMNYGLKKAGIPFFSKLDDLWFAVIALTLTYGAYVAEVYRSGIESIHWSQTAAARSLGLSYGQTLKEVIVPQAVRRIIPPLLNDFIGLQKDTALVGFIGVVEAFNQARIINSNAFNTSAITVVALLFYVITVPQARLVDRLIARDQAKTRGGS